MKRLVVELRTTEITDQRTPRIVIRTGKPVRIQVAPPRRRGKGKKKHG